MKVETVTATSADKQQKDQVPQRVSWTHILIERRNLLIDKAKGERWDEKWPPIGSLVDLTREELDLVLKSDKVFNYYNTISIQQSRSIYWVKLGDSTINDSERNTINAHAHDIRPNATGGYYRPDWSSPSPNGSAGASTLDLKSSMYNSTGNCVEIPAPSGAQLDAIVDGMSEAIKAGALQKFHSGEWSAK